ncbi:hypothetical protein [Thermoanaerobacterium sp. RBIITD]|uniref:hypothetical protein n=1 Tax=Thermoanaerobacterium sp. RBIITD TaxID=1550240 RepID=UPI000BB7920C|nr:hypothetical protein [Thermoanaerobacterium sp. RBIITD]SNX54829.1 hypothetical protein SAMN05660242_2563 [Thermoanaerobacterium sp. RBIITD]
MWTVIYMAHSMEIAEKVKDVLTKEGFLVKLKPLNKNLDNSEGYCEVMVPNSEAQDAQNTIIEYGL